MSTPIIKINLSDITISINNKKPINFYKDKISRFEEIMFVTSFNSIPLGHITVQRNINPYDSELSDELFSDLNFYPSKPRPYVLFMGVSEEYKGNGIAGKLLLTANDFYKSLYGTSLHSGLFNSPDAIRVFEKLVKQNLALEYSYNSKRRWMIL